MTGRPVWEVLTGAVRGGAHEAAGLPLQDSVGWWPGPGPGAEQRGAERVVLAVSDGHGSRDCFRSDRGARLAVGWACLAGEEALERGALAGPVADLERAGAALVADVVQRWRASVLADLSESPPTEEELAQASADWCDGDPLLAYGATLLLAVATAERLLLAQLGDGQILIVDPAGQVTCPIVPDPASVAGATSSLFQANAANACRVVALDLTAAPLDVVLLASDGYGNAFADAHWQVQVGSDVHEQLREDGPGAVRKRLASWLADAARAGGDDASLGILSRI